MEDIDRRVQRLNTDADGVGRQAAASADMGLNLLESFTRSLQSESQSRQQQQLGAGQADVAPQGQVDTQQLSDTPRFMDEVAAMMLSQDSHMGVPPQGGGLSQESRLTMGDDAEDDMFEIGSQEVRLP